MTDLVRMTARTTFHNARVKNKKGGLVEAGDAFETDVMHARDLHRLGHADPVDGSLDGREDPPLVPHHQVSQHALAADRAKRRDARPASGSDG